MTLYLYKIGTAVPVLTIEQVLSYTADSITAQGRNGETIVYSPLAEECELSSLPDCSETLRADWRMVNPDQHTRIEELEMLMAELLFGGESV